MIFTKSIWWSLHAIQELLILKSVVSYFRVLFLKSLKWLKIILFKDEKLSKTCLFFDMYWLFGISEEVLSKGSFFNFLYSSSKFSSDESTHHRGKQGINFKTHLIQNVVIAQPTVFGSFVSASICLFIPNVRLLWQLLPQSTQVLRLVLPILRR